MSDERVARLIDVATRLRWNRRQVLARATALGLSAPAISVVLAACGGGNGGAATATTTGGGATATIGGGAANTATTGNVAASPTKGGGATATAPLAGTPTGTMSAGGTPTKAAGGSTTPSAGTGRGGIVNYATTGGDTQVGNPILSTATDPLQYFIFERLMIYSDTGSLLPELAEQWSFSPDNLQLTLNLRQTSWHDGTPFTADDVIFTFDTIKADTTDTNLKSRLQVGGNFMTWEAVDSRTVRITLSEPFAPILFNLNDVHIIPKHLLQGSADINADPFNTQPVGTGYFKFQEWVPDQYVKLVRNDNHWSGDVRPDGMTVFFMADTNVTSAALDAGELDLIFTPPELQPNYQNRPADFTLHNYVYYTPITLSFNHKLPVMQDVTLRKAVRMAIDKQTLTDTVTKGRGMVASNQFADTGPLDRYNDYDNVKPVTFDVAGANKLLDDAGYTMNGAVRSAPDGTPLSFNIITYSGFEEYQNGMVILQEMLSAIGIELKPNTVDTGTLQGMWSNPNDDPAGRALELEEWPHPYEFDPDLYNELHSANLPPGSNYMWFKDDASDKLIVQGRVTTDPAKRVTIYKQLDVRRNEIIPSVPLYIAVDGWVTSNRLKGVADTPYFRRYYLTNMKDWWKEA